MFALFTTNFKRGVQSLKNNPQLIYTIAIAIFIVVAFVFIAQRFSTIAFDAQRRLINVRIGSIHDTFVKFVPDRITDVEYLTAKLESIKESNKTIQEFKIVTQSPEGYKIIASTNKEEVGALDTSHAFIYRVALADPVHSFTQEVK